MASTRFPFENIPQTSRKLIVGNWKMCRDLGRVAELDAIAAAARASDAQIVICPPFPLIPAALRHRSSLGIGAQDCHHELEGAFTGSTSAALLQEMGATHVIVGHSERRAAGETDAMVCAKAAAAIRAGVIPIICVGESAEARAQGEANGVVTDQLQASVPASARPGEIVIAYEPIWAIGSGATPTPVEVAEVHAGIRRTLRSTLGPSGGDTVRILYGGSVNAANCGWVLHTENVDGVLVGTCSLTADDFVPIIAAAQRCAPAFAGRAA